jgi:hypothetical protein
MDTQSIVDLFGQDVDRSLAAALRILNTELDSDDSSNGKHLVNFTINTAKSTDEVPTINIATSTLSCKCSVQLIRDSIIIKRDLSTVVLQLLLNDGDITDSCFVPTETNTVLGFIEEVAKDSTDVSRNRVMIEAVSQDQDVILVGKSSSGKTVACAQVATSFKNRNWSLTWHDLSSPRIDEWRIIKDLCLTRSSDTRNHLAIIDDAQMNPFVITRLKKILTKLFSSFDGRVHFLIASWESGLPSAKELCETAKIVICNGDDILPDIARAQLRNQFNQPNLDIIRKQAGDDLLVSRLTIDYYLKEKQWPEINELAELAYGKLTSKTSLDQEAIKTIYQIAALNIFEIDVEKGFLKYVESNFLNDLVTRLHLKSDGDFISLGHRSYASLILQYIKAKHSSIIASLPSPTKLAVEYLRSASRFQIRSTLERLDVARLSYREDDQFGSVFLAKTWAEFQRLAFVLITYNKKDPTWGDSTGSACFAADALSQVAPDDAIKIILHLRNRWIVDSNGVLPAPRDSDTSEREDFNEIKKSMRDEEMQYSNRYTNGDLSDNIDLDLMHRTWITGLLLGLESISREPDVNRLSALLKIAENNQLPSGAFYPTRVPWVTARVLIGLASVGETVSNPVVRRAIDWLRMPVRNKGPYRFGTWDSGTGRWNTTLGATAMCAYALYKCGVSPLDQSLQASIAYLVDHKDEWIKPGQEVDGVFALITVLSVRRSWRDFQNELLNLLKWVSSQYAWTTAGQKSSETHEESCKTAQVASHLSSIVWELVEGELDVLLEDVYLQHIDPHLSGRREDFRLQYIKMAIARIKNSLQQQQLDRDTRLKADPSLLLIGEFNEANQNIASMQRRLNYTETNLNSLELNSTRAALSISVIEKNLNDLGTQCFGEVWEPLGINK